MLRFPSEAVLARAAQLLADTTLTEAARSRADARAREALTAFTAESLSDAAVEEMLRACKAEARRRLGASRARWRCGGAAPPAALPPRPALSRRRTR